MIHPEHEAFARAVVALAREHGMEYLSMKFSIGFEKAETMDQRDPVTLQWRPGRHGDEARILLESNSYRSIEERAALKSTSPGGEA